MSTLKFPSKVQCVVGVVRFKGARRADGDRQKVEEGEP